VLQETWHVRISTPSLSCTDDPPACAGLACCITAVCSLHICIVHVQGIRADSLAYCVLLLVLLVCVLPCWRHISLHITSTYVRAAMAAVTHNCGVNHPTYQQCSRTVCKAGLHCHANDEQAWLLLKGW
jgi:hypothetical protein